METKKRLQRFLSIFLACIMILNVPMSAMAFEDVLILDVAEDAQVLMAEDDLLSGDAGLGLEDEITAAEEQVEEIPAEESVGDGMDSGDALLNEETEEQVLDNSSEEGLDLLEDESPELGEGIEIIGIEEVSLESMELFSDGAETDESSGESSDHVRITVTISDAGSIVMARKEVTVTDYDEDGSLDVDDALYAAHELAYNGGAAEGYGCETTEYGLSLTKLWGKSGSLGYWLNDSPCNSLADEIRAGDYLSAFVYQDQSGWSDAYAKFDKSEYTVTTGDALEVSLTKAVYNIETNGYDYQNVEGASLTVYDSSLNSLAEDAYALDGYNVTFQNAGTYYLVASGNENMILVPAVAAVTVEAVTTTLPAMSAPVLSENPVSNNLYAITLAAPGACKELEEAVVQYSMSSDGGETWGDWQASGKFSGLTEGQEYLFRARYAVTEYEHYSEASNTIAATAVGIVLPEKQYDIATGDTDSQGGQRVRAANIKVAGVDVVKHQETGDFNATVLLPADTDRTKEIIFVLDCVANPNMDLAKLFVNNQEAGVRVVDGTDATKGQFVYSCVPSWNENGEASVSFKTQWNTISWVTKTYTLNFRILGEENTAPKLKSGVTAETTALIAVGESYTIKLDESAFWEDAELDDITYTVSVNGADPIEASGTYYQYGPKEPGESTLVFCAKDSKGNVSEDTYTVKITAMNLTSVETGSAAVDSWNSDIKKIDLGLADVTSVIKAEDENNTWYMILDSETAKEDKLFLRVHGSASTGRWQGVNVNGKGVDGAESDGTNFIWTATYTPEWNEYGEATLVFNALPQLHNKYLYTLKLKIANGENKAPDFKDGNSRNDSVEQYAAYTVNAASLFQDADDSWLTYSVSVNGGDYVKCDEEYSYIPKTAGEHKLLFKATDIAGAVSEVFTLTLNTSEYQIPEGSYGIGNYKNDGALLSMTILNADGEKIEGVSFETDDSVEGTKTIQVTLPGTMKTNDTVKASFHIVQNDDKEPFLSTWNLATGYKYHLAVNNKVDQVSTTLSQAKGETTVYWYGQAPTSDEDNVYDTYVIKYQIARENNVAPVLAENVEATTDVTMDQYDTWSLDLSTIFTDAESDELSYTVKVNEKEAVAAGKDYRYEAKTEDDLVLVFQATDPFGSVSPRYTVNLTVNLVHRHVIETGDPSKGAFGGSISYIHIEGQETVKSSYVKTDDTHRIVAVELNDTVADDAEVTIDWVDNSQNDRIELTPSNPIKLTDGKATATIETYGNFFFRTHYYYEIQLSNKANTLPTLAEDIDSVNEKELVVGSPYEVDLAQIFTDADGDSLTYTVKVNGEEETAIDASYSYTPGKTGTYELEFHAKDSWGASETAYIVNLCAKNSEITYDVMVKVPDAVTPAFYATSEFSTEGVDTLGDELVAVKRESENGWTSYTVAVPENVGRISFRGTETVGAADDSGTNEESIIVEGEENSSDVNEASSEDGALNEEKTNCESIAWGGMSFAVEKEMKPVVLRQVQAVINTKIDDAEGNKIGLTADQAVFKVKYAENTYAVSGAAGTEENGYLYYRFLLVAADNSLVYTYYTEPLGDLANSFAANQGDTKTVATDSADILITVLPLATKNACKITAPAEAEVEMFRQEGYYNCIELIPHETIDNEDGTRTVIFNNVGRNAMFRVSKEGEITKAGYTSGGEINVDWKDDDRGPNYRRDYAMVNGNMMASRGDDSMYVNVNYRNNLQLDVEEEFQLRAYRIWEIINTDTNNIMIEPDFHYNIISGNDVISVTPYDGCSGNAKNNWLEIKGLKAGTAVLEVSYDAIDIISGDSSSFGNPAFTYNACDPARTALIVVQVGGAKNDIDFAIDANRTAGWDVEFDTLYFAGDSAELQFSPKSISGGNTIAKVEVSNDRGGSYTTLSADQDGVYTAKIVSGNNILKVTTADGTASYQVVRGDKISITLSEVSGFADQDGILDAGEKIRVQFRGVHNVIGKMSGIYNPTGYKTNYTYNGEVISGNGGQYTYPAAAFVELTLPGNAEAGDIVTLTNGNTTNGGWGSAGGAHRAVTGEVPPNLDAGGITNSGRNIFPDIAITIGEEAGNVVTPDAPEEPDTPVTPDDPTVPDDSDLEFDIAEEEIAGYVTVSFEDNAVRLESELKDMEAQYRAPLGTIVKATRVPYKAYDTIASVTLRLLKALGMTESHTGTENSGFYLSEIGNFTAGGKKYSSFGEFDAGNGSGWMITHNNWFINQGASEFFVEDGDLIKWQYTCQHGADIGCDKDTPSAEITGITFKERYGLLSQAFDPAVTDYIYTVTEDVTAVALEVSQENYWAAVTYTANGMTYKPMAEIPVEDGTQIVISCSYLAGAGEAASDTDSITITIKKDQTVAEELQKVEAAEKLVTALPATDSLTLENKAAVEEARAAYNALTAEQKAAVSSDVLKQLEAAEAKIAELQKAEEEVQKPHVHSWDAGTVTKPATCKETGVKTFKCSCGQTRTETIAKSTAHKYGSWTTVSEATVKAAEVQKHTCTICGKEETQTVGEALTPILEVPGKLKSFNIKKGKTAKFTVTMANGDSVSSVKSSKTKYLKASVDKKTGKITLKGVKKGTSKLTIKLVSGKKRTYTIKVVTGTVKTSSVSVTSVKNKKLTLAVKKTHTLKSERKPFTSTQKLTYKSSNKKVATVSSKGKIKAVAPGKAAITVSSGSRKVKITVTVPGITNVKSSVSVKRNKTLTLKPKTYGISEKVTYTSSNTKIATVTSKGKIKGIRKGTAKITIKAGTFKKTVKVKVK